MVSATVHLVRHGEVENPGGIIYGRLPGYHLSERGRRQAELSAARLSNAAVSAVWASPLERAQETAALIAEPHGLEIVTDERLTESHTTFEGLGHKTWALLRDPRRAWSFRNPVRPSWGESFVDIKERMLAAITDAIQAADGGEAVVVTHQTPVRVSRLSLARRRVPLWFNLTPCETGSVTTVVLDGDRYVSAAYFAPRVENRAAR
jgi:broad specificity phosphatase PhoE